jgi:CRISPR-associated endonuclease/helicase Cas3
VATTVIECGVDVDFPTVLRATGPLDRILQSAGRCNREGLRLVENSRVIVFPFAGGGAPRGAYSVAIAETEERFRHARQTNTPIDFDNPAFVTDFFASLYRTLGPDQMDKKKVRLDRDQFDYPTVAQKVKLIEEDTVSVLVTDCPDGEADAKVIIAEAEAIGRMTRELWQKASGLSVSLYSWDADPEKAAVDEVVPGLLVWKGRYDHKRGMPLTSDPADAIQYDPTKIFA